jgi:protein-S-isoprenylcysteine O-methyltransferase Ste14
VDATLAACAVVLVWCATAAVGETPHLALAVRCALGAGALAVAAGVPFVVAALLALVPHMPWVLRVVACVAFGVGADNPTDLAVMIVCAATSNVVFHAVRNNRFRTLRLAFFMTTMLGGMCILLPLAVSAAHPMLGDVAASVPGAVPVLLLAVGTAVFVWSCRTLLKDGGTPDPWDPPRRRQTEGPYRLMQHPMQLSQLLLLASAVLTLQTWGALLSWVVVAGVLIVPVRMWERRAAA